MVMTFAWLPSESIDDRGNVVVPRSEGLITEAWKRRRDDKISRRSKSRNVVVPRSKIPL